jgi:hypothetical protein
LSRQRRPSAEHPTPKAFASRHSTPKVFASRRPTPKVFASRRRTQNRNGAICGPNRNHASTERGGYSAACCSTICAIPGASHSSESFRESNDEAATEGGANDGDRENALIHLHL